MGLKTVKYEVLTAPPEETCPAELVLSTNSVQLFMNLMSAYCTVRNICGFNYWFVVNTIIVTKCWLCDK
jgi:hypothetical protein